MQHYNAVGRVDYGGLAQEVSEGKNISKWPRGYFCENHAKNVTVFYPCPKNLPEAKLKTFGLTALVEKILRPPFTDCGTWPLVITLMQIYNDREKLGQKEIQTVQFGEKMSVRKCNMEVKSCAQEN